MAVLKQGGQAGLQKVTDESLQQRLSRLGLPQTTNASMAQGLGATPDQTKMAGSGARKEAVLKQTADQSKTLAGAKQQQPGVLTQQEQADLASAEKLTKLGGASAQIGQLAIDKLKGAGQGQVQRQMSQEGDSLLAKAINPTNNQAGYSAAKSALVSYANDPSQRESALVTLRNLGIIDPELYLEKTDQVLNRAVQTSGLTAAEMEPVIQQYGFTDMNDLATTLGLSNAQLQGMSPTDISNQINLKRQELLDRTGQLQSQAGMTGLAGAAGQQQLQAFTQAGGLSREKEAARPTVDMSAKVKIGDTDYDMETILKDDEFSGVIEQWLAAKPEDRASIIPGDWPLSQWLTSNESALKSSMEAGAAAGLQLDEAQKGLASVKDAPKLALATIIPGFDATKTYSSAEIANLTKQWADSKFSKVDQAWLGGLSQAEIDEVKGAGYNEQDLKDMSAMSATGDKNIKAFLGIPDKKIYTKDELANYKTYAALPDDVKKLMNNPDGLYKGLSSTDLVKFADNPTLQREYEEWATERNKFSKIDVSKLGEADLSEMLYGLPHTEINSHLAKLKDQERVLGIDYSFPADTNDDGKLDLAEMRAYATTVKDNLAKPKTVDSFTTAEGFADYQPAAPKLDPGKLVTKDEYTMVKDWLDGDSVPALDNAGQIKLAMKTLQSLPKGPTRDKLFTKMRTESKQVFGAKLGTANTILGNIPLIPTNNWDAYSNAATGQLKQVTDMIKGFDTYPSDWPGIKDIKNKFKLIESKIKDEIGRKTKVRNFYLKKLDETKEVERTLANIRKAHTTRMGSKVVNPSDAWLARNKPEFKEALDKATKLRATVKTYTDFGHDEAAFDKSIWDMNYSMGVSPQA